MPEPFVIEAILATVDPFPTLRAALLTHANHKDISMHVLRVISSVMLFNPACASTVMSFITAADVLRAMSLHIADKSIVAAACACLLEWSRQPDLCTALRGTEGLIASMQGLEALFPTDAVIPAAARDVLARLAVAEPSADEASEPMQDE